MSESFSKSELPTERRITARVALIDGRSGILIDRNRELPVRVLNESIGGFRIAAEQPCSLPENSETVFRFEKQSLRVRIVYKRLEGPQTMIGLQQLGLFVKPPVAPSDV